MNGSKDKKIDRLEQEFPRAAQKLVSKTYNDVIKSGRSVVVSKDGALFRMEGSSKTKIKDIENSIIVTKSTFSLRRARSCD